MKQEDLYKATEIVREIKNLNDFIRVASSVWTGKLTIRKRILYFISSAYGIYNEEELEMNTRLKNKVLNLVKEYKMELENEFETIGTNKEKRRNNVNI